MKHMLYTKGNSDRYQRRWAICKSLVKHVAHNRLPRSVSGLRKYRIWNLV